MSAIARQTDPIKGSTGEHKGHVPAHGTMTITGDISSNCSSNVFANNLAVAYVGSVTTEKDSCCGSSKGSVAVGSSNVFVNKIPVARLNDSLNPHSGSAKIVGGSLNVFVN